MHDTKYMKHHETHETRHIKPQVPSPLRHALRHAPSSAKTPQWSGQQYVWRPLALLVVKQVQHLSPQRNVEAESQRIGLKLNACFTCVRLHTARVVRIEQAGKSKKT